MALLTREQIQKLAALSRLRLSEDEVEKYQKELSDILDYVKLLESVDVEGLTPAYQVTGLQNIMRTDNIVDYQANPADMLAGAPKNQNGYIQVGRMI